MKIKSLRFFALLLFIGSPQLYHSNIKASERNDAKGLMAIGLLAGAARYAWLEYKKPGEEKLTQFYKNRDEKNILKYTGAAILGFYIAKKIAQNPQEFLNFFKNPENLKNLARIAYGGFIIYNVWPQIKLYMSGNQMARIFYAKDIKERFSSVAGAHAAKSELQETIDFLKNPEKYEKLGTKIRRGILLTGAPGNGKTLLAKATAGEANCAFLTMSGSEFVQMFVGVGASRVRDLFEKAKALAPCIIFIDEIDSLGGKRVADAGFGGTTEHNQTLNELLAQMDGFEKSNAPIIVIGATNIPQMLDPALLRPGRFDSTIEVEAPDIASREAILKVHAKGYKIDPSVKFDELARLTMGFSGADLANYINEASHMAAGKNQKTITMDNFTEAYDKVALGKESKTKVSQKEREITAYHEAGHALVQFLLPNSKNKLDKVTIVPRGHAGGFTRSVPKEETHFFTKEDLMNQVKFCLGGKAAEEIIFKQPTGGACSDLEQSTNIIRQMVCKYGMSEKLGPVVYKKESNGVANYSPLTDHIIDEEILKIVRQCEKEVHELLTKNKNKLIMLAQELLKHETLSGIQIEKLLGEEVDMKRDHEKPVGAEPDLQ